MWPRTTAKAANPVVNNIADRLSILFMGVVCLLRFPASPPRPGKKGASKDVGLADLSLHDAKIHPIHAARLNILIISQILQQHRDGHGGDVT